MNSTAIQEIIFWGAAGQAKVLRECLRNTPLNLAAIFDNNPETKPPFPDVPLYYGRGGFESWIANRQSPPGYLVAIGGDRGKDRLELHTYLDSFGLTPVTAIHPSAFVAASAQIAPGSQILALSAVCVEVTMGISCIINTGATVDHECRLGDGVHIAPGAHLAGCVEIGDMAMIGTGAVVLPHIKIGYGAVVGAGAVVIDDVPPMSVVVGNPARIIKEKSVESN